MKLHRYDGVPPDGPWIFYLENHDSKALTIEGPGLRFDAHPEAGIERVGRLVRRLNAEWAL